MNKIKYALLLAFCASMAQARFFDVFFSAPVPMPVVAYHHPYYDPCDHYVPCAPIRYVHAHRHCHPRRYRHYRPRIALGIHNPHFAFNIGW